MNINSQNISSITEIISETLEKWTKNYSWILSSAAIFLLQFIMGIIIAVPLIIIAFSVYAVAMEPTITVIMIILLVIFMLILMFIEVFIGMGYARASLYFVRNGKYRFEDFFMGYKKFWLGLKVSLLAGLIVIASAIPAIISTFLIYFSEVFIVLTLILLIIPVIIQLRYVQILYLVQDEEISATEIVKKSSEMMKGLKGKYFGLTALISICALLPIIGITLFFGFTAPGMGAIIDFITSFITVFITSFMISTQAYFYKEIIDNDQDRINNDIIDTNYWLPDDNE